MPLESKLQARCQLLIEEYKTLRDEIGRFQNQQKQSMIAGVGAIALTLIGSTMNQGGPNFLQRPYLLLLLPLVFATLGILFFETEIGIYRAATYLGVNLKQVAMDLCGPLEGVMDWENYCRSKTVQGCRIANFGWSRLLLFLLPAPTSMVAFLICVWLNWPTMNQAEIVGHVILFAFDLFLIGMAFRYSIKADLMCLNMNRLIPEITEASGDAKHSEVISPRSANAS